MNFIDTNVLLYAFGPVDQDDPRQPRARAVLAEGNLAFSVQVFQEFFVQATHRRRRGPLAPEEAVEVVDTLSSFPVQPNELSLFHEAVAIQRERQTSFWDANILAAASRLDCERVYSEDLGHGRNYGGIRVINPFTGLRS